MKHSKRFFAALLAVLMLFSLGITALAVDAPEEEEDIGMSPERLQGYQPDEYVQRFDGAYDADEQVRAIVILKSLPTSENKTYVQRLVNNESKLMAEHALVKQQMTRSNVPYQVNFEYTALLNGMSVTMRYGDLEQVAALPNVEYVYIATHFDPPAPETQSVSSSEMIHAAWMNDAISGDGSGTSIAILDTGITLQHEAFQVYPGMLQTPEFEKPQMLDAIASIGRGVYYSQKIPFQHDYADNDNNATDDSSGHGTHVAGIAAGYVASDEGVIKFRGSAPDAQILAMKVFSSSSTGTSSDIYYAALEDAYKLGADVINMSLGAGNGFPYDESLETETYGNIFRRLEEAGIIVCISAGNDGSMADIAQNKAGNGYVTPGYADYGVLSSPASYNGNVGVAAVDNARFPARSIRVGEQDFPYRESSGTAFADTFGNREVEFVVVPGQGESEDYADIDVKDKIALVTRGGSTFESKVSIAAAAGACGVVVCNNTDDGLISMSVTTTSIPSVFVAKDAGIALKQAAENGNAKFFVDAVEHDVASPTGWGMSYFSSWGPTNDLQIKPQISGVGGSVSSAAFQTVDQYTIKSGTSMSSPNVAGGYAAFTEALRAENPDMSKTDVSALAKSRTQATARILTQYDGTPFSPRQQGAGLLDLKAADTTALRIPSPLVELGDDPGKTASYTVRFDVENSSDSAQTYQVQTDVLCDSLTTVDVGTEEAPDVRSYNALQTRAVTDRCTVSGPESVTLQPGEKKTVSVTIALSEELKQELDRDFPNGTYIEGYVRLTNDAESAHATYLAFYGDWNAAPIIEQHDWRDLMNLPNLYEYLDQVDWEVDTDVSLGYICDAEGEPVSYAGGNPFGRDASLNYDDKRIAVSTNGEIAYGIALQLTPTIIRNARHVVMIVRDADTGEIYTVDDTPYCDKTIYVPEYEMWTSSVSCYFDGFADYGMDAGTYEAIPNNTQVKVELYANLFYGEDEIGAMTPEELVASGKYLQYSVPCTVDSEAPMIESWHYDYVSGDVTITVRDNQYLAGVSIIDLKQATIAQQLFADDEPGETHTVTLHIGKQRNFVIACQDYATNEKRQRVNAIIDPTTITYSTPEEVLVDGQKSVTVSNGDQVVLPNVNGTVEGWEFSQWSSFEIADDTDPALSASETVGAMYKVSEDVTMHAVFRTPAGVYQPTEKLRRVMTEQTDWSGSYAIGGLNWSEYAFYLLNADGRTVEAEQQGITVTDDSVLNNTPGTLIFTLEKLSDGSYTIKGQNGYLAMDAKATYGLSVVQDAASDAAHWNISYFPGDTSVGDVDCVRVTNAKDPAMRIMLDTQLNRVKCVRAEDKDYSDDLLLYLFGAVEKYRYSTDPQPIHDWDEGKVTKEPTVEAEGEMTYTCKNDPSHTRTESIPKLEPPAPQKCDGGDNCPSKNLVDVDRGANSWYHEAVDWAVVNKVTNGIDPTHFGPTNACTRAQAVTFLWRAMGEPEPTITENPFKDVAADAYYYKAVLWAAEKEITNGVTADTFAPDATCTRGQIVTFLWRAEGKVAPTADASFTDVPADAYFADAVAWAVENGITNGTSPTTFAPNDNCTRAHIVTFLYRDMK